MNKFAVAALGITWLAGGAFAAELAPCGKNHYILEEPCAILATAVGIGPPTGVAVDSAGIVYVSSHNIVFRLTSAGLLERVAGNGMRGFAGDDGPATAALLATPSYSASDGDFIMGPSHIAFDAADNLYIADTANHRIRRVDAADATITTYLGGAARLTAELGWPPEYWGLSFPSGIAVDSKGRVHVTAAWMILRIPKEEGPVELVGHPRHFLGPRGLAFDGEDSLLVTDGGCLVRKLAPDGGLTNVVCEGLSYPWGVTIDQSGALIIADSANHCIRRKREDAELETIAGVCGDEEYGFSGDGGPALEARMASPLAVAVDRDGNVIIADSGNSRVRRVTPQGIIETIAGNGSRKVLVDD